MNHVGKEVAYMLNLPDIEKIFESLKALELGCRLGYAGSYARGQANESSDLDIVVDGQEILSSDAYFKIYHTLKKVMTIEFDIVDLAAVKQDDQEMDRMLLDRGLAENDCSAYKTMKKEAVWMN